MKKNLKNKLARIENKIEELVHYVGGCGMLCPPRGWDERGKEQLKELLSQRCVLLNQMFECTPDEVEAFRQVNNRLYDLTTKMHAKTLSLYQSILKVGYDPDFDDDITIEGTLRYVFNTEFNSVVWTEQERGNYYEVTNNYGSNFTAMLDILYDFYEDGCQPECAFCDVSYNLSHKPGMPASEMGLDDFLDDGKSWNDTPLDRPEFKEICICHAVHDFCTHKYYSIPDLLRMNDFWVEVKITHQHIVDRSGKRYSCIEHKQED